LKHEIYLHYVRSEDCLHIKDRSVNTFLKKGTGHLRTGHKGQQVE